jgi:hypothetical protein
MRLDIGLNVAAVHGYGIGCIVTNSAVCDGQGPQGGPHSLQKGGKRNTMALLLAMMCHAAAKTIQREVAQAQEVQFSERIERAGFERVRFTERQEC